MCCLCHSLLKGVDNTDLAGFACKSVFIQLQPDHLVTHMLFIHIRILQLQSYGSRSGQVVYTQPDYSWPCLCLCFAVCNVELLK